MCSILVPELVLKPVTEVGRTGATKTIEVASRNSRYRLLAVRILNQRNEMRNRKLFFDFRLIFHYNMFYYNNSFL